MRIHLFETCRSLPFFLLMFAALGCTVDKAAQQTPAQAEPAPPAATASPESSVAPTSPGASSWKVSRYGIGPLRAGMTLNEVKAFVPEIRSESDLETAPCSYARAASLPSGAVLMFENGRLSRVDVHSGRIKTDEGAGIDDTEDRIKSLYPNGLTVSPHKYTDGHYLTLAPQNAIDSNYRIVFETDGAKVLRFRSGVRPAVEYVEGCG